MSGFVFTDVWFGCESKTANKFKQLDNTLRKPETEQLAYAFYQLFLRTTNTLNHFAFIVHNNLLDFHSSFTSYATDGALSPSEKNAKDFAVK